MEEKIFIADLPICYEEIESKSGVKYVSFYDAPDWLISETTVTVVPIYINQKRVIYLVDDPYHTRFAVGYGFNSREEFISFLERYILKYEEESP